MKIFFQRLMKKSLRNCLFTFATGAVLVGLAARAEPPVAKPPNIVFILCDDLGYGDVHYLNPERSKIATPNMDRLGEEGMAFTDCHTSSSVCTPSRYGILTGRYNWRSRLQKGVLGGESPPLLEPGRMTVASLLKQHGYTTAALGKWHLGLQHDKKDFTRPITDGPLQHGFDSFFGIAASLDMPPYVFIENDHYTEVPNVRTNFPSFMYSKNDRPGPAPLGPGAPDFAAVDVLPKITGKATGFISRRGVDQRPFFLYLALPAPHTPLVPTKEWQGKSGLGNYGDYVMETDWSVGEVLKAIERAGLDDNTLVMFASDNGCAPYAGVKELEAQGHFPSAQFRGYKADIWDGGHRVPFLVRWPGKIKAGSHSDQLLCLTDLLATSADLLGVKLPDNAGEDSVSILPALLGTDKTPLHEAVVHHSNNGRFAIRQGNWKLELCPGSGGWGSPRDPEALEEGLPPIQLYNLHDDVGEKVNVQAKDTEIVAHLTKLLEKYVADGRSTPGVPQKNDVPVDIWKTKPKKGGAEN
jgi:arylsulfatase A-like enzyme